MSRRYLISGSALALAIVICAGAWWRRSTPEMRLSAIRAAVENERYSEALELVRSARRHHDSSSELHVLAGRTFSGLRRYDDSLKEYECISDDGSEIAVSARWDSSELLLEHLQQPTSAAAQLSRLLSQKPHHGPARVQQSALLGICGRTWEANRVRLELLREGLASTRELMLLGLDELSVENLARLDEFRRTAPEDPITRLSAAYSALRDLDYETAEKLYADIVTTAPALAEAQVRLGGLLVQRRARSEFLKWHAALPSEVESHPDLWEVRGDFARLENDPEGAERCYWEAIRSNPAQRAALQRLGIVLSERHECAPAALLLEKASRLLDVQVAAKRFHTRADQERALQAAEACARAGLDWEAWGWSLAGQLSWASTAARSKPVAGMPRMNPETDPLPSIDLSHRALPVWMRNRSTPLEQSLPPGADEPRGETRIAFADASIRMGFDFQFYSGDDVSTPEQFPFQFTGGGVGILDYDGDHWPDIFMTQGSDWPQVTSQSPRGDALFRNLAGQRFEDVARQAAVDDPGYGQGVAVGDFDNDGFPDLFVANLEGGRLYWNHGDGTFADVTANVRIEAHDWTTSCLLADLNGDGNPDLYLVNYLHGKNLFQTICRDKGGRPRGCTPYDFDPAQDTLLANTGNQRFRDVTADSGIVHPGGNGLGIAALSIEGSDRLNLFVANDTTANFWFVNKTPKGSPIPGFDESALVAGLAFDRDGRAQACMGIAVGDADGDGQLDLFVTNFYDEPNTLYLQRSGGFFDDATAGSGLREPSLKRLGFGTQFLDADLDGWLDLIVTNGHVDAQSHGSVPAAMPPQFFRNLGKASFVELHSAALGDWFSKEYRGRGLARLDWNRDGREEFVVSHLDSAASLLENVSPMSGNFLIVTLIGTVSSRDAIGTTVTLEANGRTIVRQLTAGDGYQASNQRQLVFGVGETDRIECLTVRWPTGATHVFQSLPLNTELVLVEGRASAVEMHKNEN